MYKWVYLSQGSSPNSIYMCFRNIVTLIIHFLKILCNDVYSMNRLMNFINSVHETYSMFYKNQSQLYWRRLKFCQLICLWKSQQHFIYLSWRGMYPVIWFLNSITLLIILMEKLRLLTLVWMFSFLHWGPADHVDTLSYTLSTTIRP